jgi:glycosyltransferase involved in cell wall biosynthesis
MAVRQRYHLPDAMILFVGTIEPRKNLVRLVEAYACLRRQGITHTLVIAGRRGWREDAVFATVERLGLGDHVLFPGYIPEEDLPIVYSLADLFVFPSLYEGFGLPPLEAMASGVPVVCTATSSLPEVVGDAALTVEATDTKALAIAMERALTMPDLRRELIIRGRARAARFTWEDAAHRVLGIYELVGG